MESCRSHQSLVNPRVPLGGLAVPSCRQLLREAPDHSPPTSPGLSRVCCWTLVTLCVRWGLAPFPCLPWHPVAQQAGVPGVVPAWQALPGCLHLQRAWPLRGWAGAGAGVLSSLHGAVPRLGRPTSSLSRGGGNSHGDSGMDLPPWALGRGPGPSAPAPELPSGEAGRWCRSWGSGCFCLWVGREGGRAPWGCGGGVAVLGGPLRVFFCSCQEMGFRRTDPSRSVETGACVFSLRPNPCSTSRASPCRSVRAPEPGLPFSRP